MPFGMCNASATFQRAIARALRKIVNREGSMVMAYFDDIVIATETVEDHMVRLREVFKMSARSWLQNESRQVRLYEVGNQVPGTCGLRRRYQT